MIRTLGLIGAAAIAAASPAAAVAQQGTVSYSIRASLPDTMASVVNGMKELDLQVTLAFGSSRAAFTLAAGPAMQWAGNIDLSQARVLGVLNRSGDSLTMAVLLPQEIAMMMGGSPGIRMDLPLSTMNGGAIDTDSLLREEQEAKYENTGRRDTVAGRSCELWNVTSPTAPRPMEMCVAEAHPVAKRMFDWSDKVGPLSNAMTEIQEASRKRFGGRDMMVLRMRYSDGSDSFTMEMLDITEGEPDAGFFLIPEGLQVIGADLIQGMIQQQSTGG